MKIVFSYELLYPPYDEGVKNLAYMIYQTLDSSNDVKLIRDFPHLPNFINSILIIPRIIFSSMSAGSDKVVYIPKGALTFSAIIKVWLARIFLGNRLSVVSVQRKTLGQFQKRIVRKLKVGTVFTLSAAMANELSDIGIPADVLPTGIDLSKFTPDTASKAGLRKKYSLPDDKRILLHVGHIRESRNILWLQDIQKSLPDIQVVIIGSTSTSQDEHVRLKLEADKVIILREAFPEIQEIYQASDIYCFPVTRLQGAMEIPLSVIEAMATNLPVITSRFGRLPELFEDDDCYRYVEGPEDIKSLLATDFGSKCTNRNKVTDFTWEHTASILTAAQ